MPMTFHCPYCGWSTELSDQYLGRSGNCVACGKPIEIPNEVATSGPRPRMADQAVRAMLILLVVALSSVIGVLSYRWLSEIRPSNSRQAALASEECKANLRLIAQAMLRYESQHGHFPPAETRDEDGIPLHSWRTLLLPYLGYPGLYDQIRLDEPWNSPHNLRMGQQMPPEYGCPLHSNKTATETNYVVIRDKYGACIFRGDTETRIEEITDNIAKTVLVIELGGRSVHWMEPRDIDVADLQVVNFTNDPLHHDGVSIFVAVDGSLRTFDNQTTPEDLHSMATKSGGELVSAPMAN